MLFFTGFAARSQQLKLKDPYLKIDAKANDPLYTTYAAAMKRSRLYGDKAYKMNFYTDNLPLNYSSDKAGRMYNIWLINKIAIDRVGKYYRKPHVVASFPDMVMLEYEPFKELKVYETFLVYSSKISIVDMVIANTANKEQSISTYPVMELGNDSLYIEGYDKKNQGYLLKRHETKKRLISNLYTDAPYPTELREFFTANFKPYSYGGYKGSIEDFYYKIKTDYYATDFKNDSLNQKKRGMVDMVALHKKFKLKPGETKHIRYIRGIQAQDENTAELIGQINKLKNADLQPYLDADVKLFQNIPRIDFKTASEKLVYLGALNLARGCMLPPTGKATHNFYVFSRNPKWGWGHGHQVLHESLSMMAYAYLDPQSAEESQRVYMEQQGKDGLIPYRVGPRGAQTYPHKGEPTTSSPFYSWTNWEIYKVSKDRNFLKQAYDSGIKYTNWLLQNRDNDKDDLFEWGPYGLIENVRDWYNVIFQVSKERHLDIDKEDISDELEDLDLSLMVVSEMKSLSKMAAELGEKEESKQWSAKADHVSNLINKYMWDDQSGFYYHVDKKNHSFHFMSRDLRRKEIIGFLPLWAGVASQKQAARLVDHLKNSEEFWRTYGVPTLSANDPFYSPYVDYCCKWNGPVWMLWDYLVYDGLRNYGYDNTAERLSDKMMLAVTTQLSRNHNFWESYSPDNTILDSPSNYIWDSILAKLLIERYRN
jgi:hypothetical protein